MRAFLSLVVVAALTATPALAKSRTTHPPKKTHVRHSPAQPLKSKTHGVRGGGSNDNG